MCGELGWRIAVAAPVKVGNQIACVLAVGAAVSEPGTSAAHLDRLATALAQAYERQLQSR